MSKNTKLYTFSNSGAPKMYNNSKWGELIRVIRHCVNGGGWHGINKIGYNVNNKYVRIYLDNIARTYSLYQTIQLNDECGKFSNLEAIIRKVSSSYIDVTFHDDIRNVLSGDVVNLGMQIRVAPLGFTEAFTDRDCGVFKTENHDFHFCINDNDPSNAVFTYVNDNSMFPRPTVYMCDGMDVIHSNIGNIFPYSDYYPYEHIGGNHFKFTSENNTFIQNGLFNWGVQYSNSSSSISTTKNTAFTEIKWWVIGNGDNINLIVQNPNNLFFSSNILFFQTIFNGNRYTPIMNGYFNSLTINYYQRTNAQFNASHYGDLTTTFHMYNGYSPYINGKLFRQSNSLYTNTIMLYDYKSDVVSSVRLYPRIYTTSLTSGSTGTDFLTNDRILCAYYIQDMVTSVDNVNLKYFNYIKNNITTMNNGEIINMVDNNNSEHLYIFVSDLEYIASSSAAIDDSYGMSGGSTQYKIKMFVDLLGRYDE